MIEPRERIIDIDTCNEDYTLLTRELAFACFPERERNSNKGDFGYIALIGGSLEYSGAIRLAAMANCAARSGAGVVTVAVPKDIAYLIAENILECTVYPLAVDGGAREENIENLVAKELGPLCNKYKVIAVGMGIGTSDFAKKRVEYLLKNYEGTLIVDADGLNIMASMDSNDLSSCKAKLILTPHLKEFSRLSGLSMDEISKNPIARAKEYARNNNCIVLLKGSTTVVTDGTKVYLVNRGCPGMATAGSGDVLSGCLAAIAAYNQDNLLLATATSAYVCGLAGELAESTQSSITMIASDTAKAINEIVKLGE